MAGSRILYLSELDLRRLQPKRINELNDNFETENLVYNIKQTMFQDYKSAYKNMYPYPLGIPIISASQTNVVHKYTRITVKIRFTFTN